MQTRESAPTADQTLNEIVARNPQSLPVLNSWGLDTCCGAGLSLREAARRHNLDLEAILSSLAAVGR